ncbi:Protein of unknown function [Lentibacillus halodurans]|uniref:DNA-binding ferritin-like protein (Dps family) n=1 Tax=Lentibacillus halodurans TaxID=237679 RepID=A0A1I0XTM8_9BACI|nr:DUF1129 family protein [Lentibacillus halodurans]SFB04499.1 Protein of unknown function [Lentibacillus halodurans]
MNTKDLIQLNNEKRNQLTEENNKYYGDMLVYIRTNFNKSERYTEEVLLELLEHLLQAQAAGRSAKEVFGDDPKTYCDDIVGEIPSENKSNRITFALYIVLNLIGTVGLTVGFVGFILHSLFELGNGNMAFPVGSGMLIIFIDLLLLALFIFMIFKWIKGSTFNEKRPKKWIEFLWLWALSTLFIGLTMLVLRIMPDIGTDFHVSFPAIILIAGIVYLISFIMNKKMRIIN